MPFSALSALGDHEVHQNFREARDELGVPGKGEESAGANSSLWDLSQHRQQTSDCKQGELGKM